MMMMNVSVSPTALSISTTTRIGPSDLPPSSLMFVFENFLTSLKLMMSSFQANICDVLNCTNRGLSTSINAACNIDTDPDNRILNRKRKSRKSRRSSHIDCIICHAKLRTISSYSFHVRHFHSQISLYSLAVGHVLHLRSAGQEFVLALQCPLCEIVDSGWCIISHLMVTLSCLKFF